MRGLCRLAMRQPRSSHSGRLTAASRGTLYNDEYSFLLHGRRPPFYGSEGSFAFKKKTDSVPGPACAPIDAPIIAIKNFLQPNRASI